MTIGGNHTKIRNKGLGAKLPSGYLGDQMDKLGAKVGPKPMLGGIIDLAPLHDGGPKLYDHQMEVLDAVMEGRTFTLPARRLGKSKLNQTNSRVNIVDQLPKEPRFKKAGPKGQYDRRILLSERGERIVEYHATKGWRSYRAA